MSTIQTADGEGRRERAEATREKLVSTAERLFAEHGFDGVSTAAVVEHSGLTRGALYHHFSDKRHLFAEVYECMEREMIATIAGRLEQAGGPWERLVQGLTAFLDVCSDARVQRIVYTDGPAVLGVERRREVAERYGVSFLERTLRDAMDAGVIRAADPTSLAHLLHGSLAEAAMLIAGADDRERAREAVELPLVAVLEALRAEPR